MNKHKLAFLVLLFVYPVITAILYGMVALTTGWEVWERTLVLAPLMVGLMVYILIPFITTRFKGYLMGVKKAATPT